MIDIFQIHWYFGSARCKKHEQQKQYVFVALLQTQHKITSHTAPHTANYARTAQNATKVTMEH